ncbi:MAG TPA: hypothetical protein VM934_04630 [Pyrinomonadaceae bacterium]|nr:hypothetical protein [Pyrinomonadaceae bacterium]
MNERLTKVINSSRWLPAYGWQRLTRRKRRAAGRVHLMIALADHFEPSYVPGAPSGTFAPADEQRRRLDEWCRVYPKAFDKWRDAEGQPFRHTYFYPAEQYERWQLDQLAEHCQDGWGEVEIHLHHGVEAPDTSENTRRMLADFRDTLVSHGCLSRWDGEGEARYAFVHGNWALANSAGGACCGVDDEMRILADTGCYADMTLPSAPDIAQVPKINALYECGRPLEGRAPHRDGRDLRSGVAPQVYPLIIGGPLGLDFGRRVRGVPVPYIENSILTTRRPATMERLRHWREAGITVHGRPDWLFIKLCCHGMDPRDREAMLGELMQKFLAELTEGASDGGYQVHFVTAREMVNVILAACDGREGNPGDYRDYRLRLVKPPRAA